MTISTHQANKELIGAFRSAFYDCNPLTLQTQLNEIFASDAAVHLASPFNNLDGPDALFEAAYQPLISAIPDLERRDYIVMAGESSSEVYGSQMWVGCAGFYTGVFEQPRLDIPPTLHAVFKKEIRK